jgi:hypothetical protein
VSTHQTVFSHDLRILACANCGGPIEGTPTGGTVTCSFCNTVNQVAARDETRDRAAATTAPTMNEAQRFEQLRAQDGKPLMPPPNLAHLLQGGGLPPQNVQAAQAEWQRARFELTQAPGNFASAERLYFLTMMIYGALSKLQGQDRQIRAMVETALDLLTDARHRQEMHGMLARNAARVGDVAAAEQWLALCNPYSHDLQADTAYRHSRAYVSTCKRDYPAVLQALGARIDDVPIADSADEACGVLRANAYEGLGQMQTAVEQLVQLMTGHPAGSQLIERIIAANAVLGLCTHSYPQARQQLGQMAASAVQTKGGFKFGCLFFPLFFGGFAIPAVIFGAQAVLDPAYHGAVVGIVVTGFMVFTFGLLGFTFLKGAKVKAHLRQHGVAGRAKVMSVSETGTRVNNQPQLQFQLHVNVPGMPPYTAIHREVVSAVHMARLGPGADLPVRVAPNDRAMLMIDWSQP